MDTKKKKGQLGPAVSSWVTAWLLCKGSDIFQPQGQLSVGFAEEGLLGLRESPPTYMCPHSMCSSALSLSILHRALQLSWESGNKNR